MIVALLRLGLFDRAHVLGDFGLDISVVFLGACGLSNWDPFWLFLLLSLSIVNNLSHLSVLDNTEHPVGQNGCHQAITVQEFRLELFLIHEHLHLGQDARWHIVFVEIQESLDKVSLHKHFGSCPTFILLLEQC
jgi:hypothetical protein